MIGLIIKKDNINIFNLVNGINHYHRTPIPLINWSINDHNKFESALNKCQDIIFENKKAKYQYISKYVGNKDIDQCISHFKYCREILLNNKENNNVVWIEYKQYLENKNITKVFKKFFFIEIINSFDLIDSNSNTIYILNNIENINNDFKKDIYKKILITGNNFKWWLNIDVFINIYKKKYKKENKEMEKLLLNGYMNNDNIYLNFNENSKRCFQTLILNPILKLYNVCKDKKYKKLEKMLKIISIDFNLTEEFKSQSFELFNSIMEKWMPFPDINHFVDILYHLENK